jgi:hypothetical protein
MTDVPVKDLIVVLLDCMSQSVAVHTAAGPPGRSGDSSYDSAAVAEQARLLFRLHTLLLAPLSDACRTEIIGALMSSPVAVPFLSTCADLLLDSTFAQSYRLAWLAAVAAHQLLFDPRFPLFVQRTPLVENAVLQLKASSAAVATALDSAADGVSAAGMASYPLYSALLHLLSDFGSSYAGLHVLVVSTPLLFGTLAAVVTRESRAAANAAAVAAAAETGAPATPVPLPPLAVLAKDLLTALAPASTAAAAALRRLAPHPQ